MKCVPIVSVVIPAYNVSPYIQQAVESALNQTVTEIEVLLIDDGSTDGTIEQLSEFRDHRLKIIRRNHAGVSVTRNVGIEVARARHIGFLDGDDIWLPHKLEKHLALMEFYPDADMTFSLSRDIDETGRTRGLPPLQPAEVISFRELLRQNLVRTTSTVVVRKEAFLKAGLFDPSLVSCEDYDMWLRIAKLRPNNLRCLKEVLTLYRRRPDQLTKDWRSLSLSWHRMMAKIGQTANQDVPMAEPQARSRMYTYLSKLAYEKEEFLQGLKFLWLGFQSEPFTSLFRARSWFLAAACLSGSLLPMEWHRSLEQVCTRWAGALYSRITTD